ncbi:MAG: glutamine synthetase family protein [Burkholderiaceae bacterium]|jgi:glutamine synthetase|nr:glutamine synthetase family protein [Burkholderiales bacterium]MCZ8340597.1 glutamine synthetase family protein [Burkholderiaceae bacterium]
MTERLRLLFCDHLSIARGKYVPLRADGGAARFCRGTFGVTYGKELIPVPGATVLDGLPDMELVYGPDDVRPGWQPRTRAAVGDLKANDGSALPMCGRSALKRAIEDWRALGYDPMVGIELEAFAFQVEADGSLKPYDTPAAHVYATGPFADPRGFTEAIWERATAAGFRIDSLNTEYDSPQFEFTLTYDHALRAVDDIFLFRLLAREVAIEHGIVLTFMPKPILALGGSGVHVNFSLRDREGRNAISGGHDPAAFDALTLGCTAGLMRHHAGLAGLLAPCANSYQRLRPASLSGFWRNWGVDHRNVTVRLSPEAGAAARIEHRMADGAANPYTATAAVLQAARLGVVGRYALQPHETGDGLENTDATESVAESLAGALDALEADEALVEAVGRGLVDNHVGIKRHEIARTADLDEQGMRDHYIRFV